MDLVLAKKNPENLFLECNSKTNIKGGYKSLGSGAESTKKFSLP